MQSNNSNGEFDQELEILEQYVDSAFRKLNRTTWEIRNDHKHTRHHHFDDDYLSNEKER